MKATVVTTAAGPTKSGDCSAFVTCGVEVKDVILKPGEFETAECTGNRNPFLTPDPNIIVPRPGLPTNLTCIVQLAYSV